MIMAIKITVKDTINENKPKRIELKNINNSYQHFPPRPEECFVAKP